MPVEHCSIGLCVRAVAKLAKVMCNRKWRGGEKTRQTELACQSRYPCAVLLYHRATLALTSTSVSALYKALPPPRKAVQLFTTHFFTYLVTLPFFMLYRLLPLSLNLYL
jgi:hypothetical protein